MNFSAIAAAVGRKLEEQAKLNAVIDWSQAVIDEEASRVGLLKVETPLRGTPIAIKDNIVCAGQQTTCGSRILEGYHSPFDATAVARLRAAGAMIVAKTNLDEFAMGSSTEHSAFGRTLNPLDHTRVPGGSSGGSAAVVAAGVVPAALGSETGGSVRQPASFCGIVGVKPTYGRVSRWGLVAFASSMDCISVFGDKVDSAARVLETISGHDPLDVTSANLPPLTPFEPRDSLRGLRIGIPREYFPPDLDSGIRAGCDRAMARFRELGAELVPVSLPHTSYAVPCYYVLNPAEAAANLARFDGVRYGRRRSPPNGGISDLYCATRGEGFGAEVRRRILVGTYVLCAGYQESYYLRALQVRRLLAQDFEHAFASGIDILFTPTTPSTAFVAGERLDDPVSMYLADVFVCAVSLAGLPAMTVPIGRSEGLPIGGQLIAPAFEESLMLSVGEFLERSLDATLEVR